MISPEEYRIYEVEGEPNVVLALTHDMAYKVGSVWPAAVQYNGKEYAFKDQDVKQAWMMSDVIIGHARYLLT